MTFCVHSPCTEPSLRYLLSCPRPSLQNARILPCPGPSLRRHTTCPRFHHGRAYNACCAYNKVQHTLLTLLTQSTQMPLLTLSTQTTRVRWSTAHGGRAETPKQDGPPRAAAGTRPRCTSGPPPAAAGTRPRRMINVAAVHGWRSKQKIGPLGPPGATGPGGPKGGEPRNHTGPAVPKRPQGPSGPRRRAAAGRRAAAIGARTATN